MNDLISRQAAIDFKVSHGINECDILYVPYGEVKKYLKQLPSAEPEIIMCMDCKNWERRSACEGYCHEMYATGFDENFFCGYAERIEDEAD